MGCPLVDVQGSEPEQRPIRRTRVHDKLALPAIDEEVEHLEGHLAEERMRTGRTHDAFHRRLATEETYPCSIGNPQLLGPAIGVLGLDLILPSQAKPFDDIDGEYKAVGARIDLHVDDGAPCAVRITEAAKSHLLIEGIFD